MLLACVCRQCVHTAGGTRNNVRGGQRDGTRYDTRFLHAYRSGVHQRVHLVGSCCWEREYKAGACMSVGIQAQIPTHIAGESAAERQTETDAWRGLGGVSRRF